MAIVYEQSEAEMVEDKRQVGIEITPEMIEVGVKVLLSSQTTYLDDLVHEVFEKMQQSHHNAAKIETC